MTARQAVAVIALAVAVTVALERVPTLGGPSGVAGFDTSVAHLVLMVAAVATVGLGWLAAGSARGATPTATRTSDRTVSPDPTAPADPTATPGPTSPPTPALGSRAVTVEAVAVFLGFLVIYFPPFLARYGPYGEDRYFFTAIQRVFDGQRPYADFEFIYGPLLIAPISRWLAVTGYAMAPYYWFVALAEAATFAGVVVVLGRFLPGRAERLAALAVLIALLLNDNLGLSWLALRRLLPVVVVGWYALRGPHGKNGVVAAGLIGAQVVLSLEYAAAAILGIGAIGLVESIVTRRVAPVGRAIVVGTAGLGVGLGFGAVLLGGGVGSWLRATWEIIVVRGGGEAGFPFQWSVNAVAVFALMLAAAWRIGAGLRAAGAAPAGPDPRAIGPGDRWLVGALGYCLIAMKSGLARSDMYHLVPPVLGLVAAGIVPIAAPIFRDGVAGRTVTRWVIALICLTYLPGLIGAGRSWAQGWVFGARDLITGRPRSDLVPVATRSVRLGAERTVVDSGWVRAAEYFAAPVRAERPVVYYGRTWGLDKMIGVPKPKGYYPTDDYLVSDQIGAGIRRYLEANPTAFVVVHEDDWRGLEAPGTAPPRRNMFWFGGERSVAVIALERWSSSHFGVATLAEAERKQARWTRTVGEFVVAHYGEVARFGPWRVLSRR